MVSFGVVSASCGSFLTSVGFGVWYLIEFVCFALVGVCLLSDALLWFQMMVVVF